MKKKLFAVCVFILCNFILASFSPSLDGRAVVAEPGVMPKGIFAKTVGYLPGDSISVTNLMNKTTFDILVIGAIDPSEGIAILLSPEAAEVLGLEKGFNAVVKITKRSGQLDEAVSGTAVIGAAPNYYGKKTEEKHPAKAKTAIQENKKPAAEKKLPPELAEIGEEEVKESPVAPEPEETKKEVEIPEIENVIVKEDIIEDKQDEKNEELSAAQPEEIILETKEEPQKEIEPLQPVVAEEKTDEKVDEDVIEEEKPQEEPRKEPEKKIEMEKIYADKIDNAEDRPLKSERVEADNIVSENDIYEEYVEGEEISPDEVKQIMEESVRADKLDSAQDVVAALPFEEEELPAEPEDKSAVSNEKILSDVIKEHEDVVAALPFEEEELPAEPENKPAAEEPEAEEVYADNIEPEIPAEAETEKVVYEEIKVEEAEEAIDEPVIDSAVTEEPEVEIVTEDNEGGKIILVPVEQNPPSEVKTVETVAVKEPEPNSPPEIDAAAEKKSVEIEEKNSGDDFEKYTKNSIKDLEVGKYYIQIASSSDMKNIKSIFDKYSSNYPIVLVPSSKKNVLQVLIGPLTIDEYGTVLNRFKSYGYKDAFLRKIR